ncbi:MAG: hypothetical protein JW793_05115 [Acidobacteria bacterium]|nr:hypothetical protein [Acidobacteriota bacterium]
MAYYHWASHPVKLKGMRYAQSGHPKPNGLWFDVDGSWKRWCEAARFRLQGLRYRHIVTVLDASRVLFLGKAEQIDLFTQRYGHNLSGHIQPLQSPEEIDAFARRYGRDLLSDILEQFSRYIQWSEVAKKYAGIIIKPYFTKRSRNHLWYYGWNCSGGCIWDTSIIRLGRPRRMDGPRPLETGK